MKTVRRPRVSESVVRRINRVEARHKGRIVAIEPVSGDYVIADTQIEALRRARRRHPGSAFVFSGSSALPAIP